MFTSVTAHFRGSSRSFLKTQVRDDNVKRETTITDLENFLKVSSGTAGKKFAATVKATASSTSSNAEDIMGDFKMPVWVDMILAVTGIMSLQFRIQEERERRAEDYFRNPYERIHTWVNSTGFEVFIASTIVINCVVMGWEASVPEESVDDITNVLEHFFTAFFLIEWVMRVLANGWTWLFEIANVGDTVLVIGGVLLKWVMEPLGGQVEVVRIFTVLRVLRLVRMAHALRTESMCTEMWMLIYGMTTCLQPLLWVTVVGVGLVYVFAICATELIGRGSDFKDNATAQELFGNIGKSMFTLFQVMTLDNYFAEVVRPITAVDPNFEFFFILFVAVGVFVFWNLITSIIVKKAFQASERDQALASKEAENLKKQEVKMLGDVFLELDKDNSGYLTTDEFFSALQSEKVLLMLHLLDLNPNDMQEVWNLLDDGDGQLTIKEFTSGLRRMNGKAKSKDVIDTDKKLQHTKRHLDDLNGKASLCLKEVEALESECSKMTTAADEALGCFMEMWHRLDTYMHNARRQDAVEEQRRERERIAQLERELEEKRLAEAEEDGDSSGGGSDES